jgi:ATP-dependent exoDNAse (exonuclease V) alpha subunit
MSFELKEQQLEAYNGILSFLAPRFNDSEKFFLMDGGAGTGKTFVVSKVNENVGRFGSVYCGPTNKSTKVLQSTIGQYGTCKTIFSLLGIKMTADEDRLVLKFPSVPVDLSGFSRIFIDEASMLNKTLMDYILERSEYYTTKWILIGDKYQLPPVGEEESPVWSLKCKRASLTKVVRYDNEILNFATMVRKNVRRYPKVRLKFKSDHSGSQGVWKYDRGGFMKQVERAAKKGLFTQIDNTKACAWRNRTVTELNEFIRFCIFGKEADANPWIVGDRICIGEPVQKFGKIIANIDDEGTIIEVASNYHSEYKDLNCFQVVVQIDGGAAVQLDILHPNSAAKFQRMLTALADDAKRTPSKWKYFWALKNSFHNVRYSYAMTAHRLQGSTLTNVFLDTADIMANANSFEALRCLYVGATRATTKLILV